MNRHYERYLFKKYEPLYRGRHQPITENLLAFGFAHDDGWFNIINNLSAALCKGWLSAKREYDEIANKAGQLKHPEYEECTWNPKITEEMIAAAKDKLALEYVRTPVAVQVKEKFGGLRFYANNCDDRASSLISFAELMSETTCEVCGRRGKITGPGWLRCLCKEHRKKSDRK